MLDIESSIQEQLPDVTPEKRKTVTETYDIVYFGAQKGSAKTVYELRQSPIISIEDVRATVNGSEQSLPDSAYESRAVDSDQVDSVAFVEPELYPDVDTTFEITYRVQPVIERYVDAYDNDIESVSTKLDEIKRSHYIRSADENELRQLGALFGELGRQRSRSLPAYRQYLTSIVASFDARGTIPGIKFILDAGFGIDGDDVTIIEDFESRSYEIKFADWPAVNTENIKDVLEIADASGVKRERLIFLINRTQPRVTTSATTVVDRGQIGVFYGFDRFNADGAFASGERNDVFAERTSSIADIQTQTEPLSDTTVVEGFADSVFSVGDFDGVRDRTLTLTETVIDPVQFFALIADIQTVTQSERPQRRFGVFEFDGLDVSVTTVDVIDITSRSSQLNTSGVIQSFGSGAFAAGVLDGIDNIDESDVVDITTVSISPIGVVSALTSSQTIQRDQFSGGVFDGPIQRETTLITPATVTPTSAQTVDETVINDGISGDFFNGSIQRDITQSSIGTISVSSNLTIEQTDQSFGSGAFAAGVLDGIADEPVSVSKTQSQSARIDKTVTLTNDRHMQSFGSGAFAAGVLDGGSDTTVLASNTQTQISEVQTTPAVTSGITSETDGFGSGSFSGSADFT